MAVLPGSQKVDLALLRGALGAERVTLVKESAFKDRFPECDPGAMPPFGNAGSHTQLAKMAYRDFA